jgi:hypothetical protein
MQYVLFYLAPIAAGIVFLISLSIYLRRPVELYLRLFSFYLLFDCLTEFITNYLALHVRNTVLLSSLTTMVQFCFYIYLLREVIHGQKAKRVLFYCLLIFPLIFAGNIFLVQTSQVFQSITYSLGCLLVASACIYYFWELFQSKHSINLTKEPVFWICSGLLIYYVCTFPVLALVNFIKIDNSFLGTLEIILDILQILLYLSFTIAFICRLRTRKLS